MAISIPTIFVGWIVGKSLDFVLNRCNESEYVQINKLNGDLLKVITDWAQDLDKEIQIEPAVFFSVLSDYQTVFPFREKLKEKIFSSQILSLQEWENAIFEYLDCIEKSISEDDRHSFFMQPKEEIERHLKSLASRLSSKYNSLPNVIEGNTIKLLLEITQLIKLNKEALNDERNIDKIDDLNREKKALHLLLNDRDSHVLQLENVVRKLENSLKKLQNEDKNSKLETALDNLKLGNFDAAEQLFKDNLLDEKQKEIESNKRKFESLYQLGNISFLKLKFKESLSYFTKASIFDETSFEVYMALGLVSRNLGLYQQSKEHYLKSIDLLKRHNGSDKVEEARLLNGLSIIYLNQAKFKEADEILVAALSTLESNLGRDHPDTVSVITNLSVSYKMQGKYTEAEEMFWEVYEVIKSKRGNNHVKVGDALNNLSEFYRNIGKFNKAKELQINAIGILEENLGKTHPACGASWNNLGLTFLALKEIDQAKSSFDKAFEIYKLWFDAKHPRIATINNNLGSLYSNLGDLTRALVHHKESLNIRRNSYETDHVELANSYFNIGIIYIRMGKITNAKKLLDKSLNVIYKKMGYEHPKVALILSGLAEVCFCKKEFDLCESHLNESVRISKLNFEKGHPELIRFMSSLAQVYSAQEKYEDAKRITLEIFDFIFEGVYIDEESIESLKNHLDSVNKKLVKN